MDLDHRNCHRCGFSAEEDFITEVWTCERLSCGITWTLGAAWQHYCTSCRRHIDLGHGCGCQAQDPDDFLK